MNEAHTIEEKRARYKALLHAMQTGVAYVMAKDGGETTPKHLRVGINAAMVEHAALANILIKKGIISEEEYVDQLIIELEREVESYKRMLSNLYGANIDIY